MRAGCWCRCAVTGESENLFMAVIYYGTGLLFMVIGNYLPKVPKAADKPVDKRQKQNKGGEKL